MHHLLQFDLASFVHGFLLIVVVLFMVTFALPGGSVFQGVLGRGHVRMYLPLSPCLSLHAILCVLVFALGGALLVARGNAPLRQLGL